MRGAFVFALAAACGGVTASLPLAVDDASADAADDAGDDAIHFGDDAFALPDSQTVFDAPPPGDPCPQMAPEAGAPCNTNLVCEYGDQPTPVCNALFQCSKRQCSNDPPTWRQIGLASGCPLGQPSGCPSVYAEASDGGACGASGVCQYTAARCVCSGQRLQCSTAPSSCPAQRPRLGTPCSVAMAPGDVCFFEVEGFPVRDLCSADGYRCSSGTWTVVTWCALPPPAPC